VPGGYANHVVPQDGALPRPLELNKDAGLMPLPISDDLVSAEKAGRLKSIDLRVKIDNLADADKVSLSLNGHKLDDIVRSAQWLTCNPPSALIECGRNQLGVVLTERAKGATTTLAISDVQLRVSYRR